MAIIDLSYWKNHNFNIIYYTIQYNNNIFIIFLTEK